MAKNNSVKRKGISPKARFEILKRDKFTCRYCGAKAPDVLLHIEHIKPIAKGGTNDYENLIAACEECNQGKGARLLTDQTLLDKSHDLLAKSQAEIEQLEEMIKWRKEVTKKKAKQEELVVTTLEEAANCSFSEFGRSNVLKAYKKYGLDLCAESILEYLEDCDFREEKGLKQYSFVQYIHYQQIRDTIEGKRKYLLGIVRNRTSIQCLADFNSGLKMMEDNMKEDEKSACLDALIQKLKQYNTGTIYIKEVDFINWWHPYMIIYGFEVCCDYHRDRGFPNE